MKNLHEQFSDEEKQHLNYLGSMMGRPNTTEEQAMEDILEAMEKGRKQTLEQDVATQDQALPDEGAE
jgi:predicted DNA-binding protein